MKALLASTILVVLFWMSSTEAARILFLSGLSSRSHKNAFMPVIKELGNRGHEVVLVTAIKASKPSKGVTEVIVEEFEKFLQNSIPEDDDMLEKSFSSSIDLQMLKLGKDMFVNGCEFTLRKQYIQDLVAGKEPKPDLILVNAIYNDCNLGIAHKLGVPFIYFSPGFHMPWLMPTLRIPHDPTFCPLSTSGSTDRMSFWERLQNAAMLHVFNALHNYYWGPEANAVMRKYLGEDLPTFQEIGKNFSLIILNSHFSMDYPRPATPNIIEAGGMHIGEAKPLPKDLEDWMAGSGDHGVVYFSLGSAFPGSKMPEKFRLMFIEVFSKLPQRVLWKWEKDEMPGLPSNVKISKWLPQQDLLGHPKLKVFITHGGLLSTMESTHFGVPVIGLPIFADQEMNMKNTELSGAGIKLKWSTLSTENLASAINKLIRDENYRINVARRSAVSQDREMHPLDKAVYWVEYVLRHKGAYHLQPGSIHLNDVQFFMLDIYFLFHTLVVVFVLFTYFLCRRCCYKKQGKAKRD